MRKAIALQRRREPGALRFGAGSARTRRSSGGREEDDVHPMLQLQRSIGNAAMCGLMRLESTRADEDDRPDDPTLSAPEGAAPEDERMEAPATAEPRSRAESSARADEEDKPDDPSLSAPEGAAPEDERAEGAPLRRKVNKGGPAGSMARTVQRLFTDEVPTTFPSYARIVASPTVSLAATGAWLETLRTTTRTGRREQGFWIQWNSKWGTFRTCSPGLGPVVGPAQGATVNLPPKPADEGNWYTVGSFHTHTPTTYRTVGRAVGPSGADISADASDNVAGVVYDFWGDGNGNLPAGRSRLYPARLYHSGDSRRT